MGHAWLLVGCACFLLGAKLHKNKVSLEENLKDVSSSAAELAAHDYQFRPFSLAEKLQDCDVPAKAGHPLWSSCGWGFCAVLQTESCVLN